MKLILASSSPRRKELLTQIGFVPDVILMNNDMSSGIPDILIGAMQPIVPSLSLGWYRRR